MTGREAILQAALDSALKLAEDRPWDDLTLSEIARDAGHGLDLFHGVADKSSLTRALESHLDEAMSEGSLDPDESPRTRLFDVLMLRFEAMEERRPGLMSYLRWRDGSVEGQVLRGRARLATARWALACSGLDATHGLTHQFRLAGLAWIYGRAETAWLDETSADLSRTMSVLDSELVKAGRRMSWLGRLRSRRGEASSPGSA